MILVLLQDKVFLIFMLILCYIYYYIILYFHIIISLGNIMDLILAWKANTYELMKIPTFYVTRHIFLGKASPLYLKH